jgi:hypothetical protein
MSIRYDGKRESFVDGKRYVPPAVVGEMLGQAEAEAEQAGLSTRQVSFSQLDDRVACDFPMFYPQGDSVVVYVREDEGRFEVTDYGEGFGAAVNRPGARRRAVKVAAQEICASLGVGFFDGRVTSWATPATLGDALWRVASASARISGAATFARPQGAATQ